jgi:hypothetical protein
MCVLQVRIPLVKQFSDIWTYHVRRSAIVSRGRHSQHAIANLGIESRDGIQNASLQKQGRRAPQT